MADNKVIDINMHFLPTDLFTNEEVLNGFLYSAPITMGLKAYRGKTPDGAKDQIVLATEDGKDILNYVEGDYTLETKLRAMDEVGVDIALLRMPVWQEWLRLDTCRIVNDQAAEMCRQSEGRLYANAVLPPNIVWMNLRSGNSSNMPEYTSRPTAVACTWMRPSSRRSGV